MDAVGERFVRAAVHHLKNDFLPKLTEGVALLSEEEIWRRPGKTTNSIGNLLLHLEGNIRQHIISGVGGTEDVRVRHREFSADEGATGEELLANLEQTVHEACRVLENLDPADLTNVLEVQGNRTFVLDDILHVVEHFSYHTGQILFAVKGIKNLSFPWYDYLKDT